MHFPTRIHIYPLQDPRVSEKRVSKEIQVLTVLPDRHHDRRQNIDIIVHLLLTLVCPQSFPCFQWSRITWRCLENIPVCENECSSFWMYLFFAGGDCMTLSVFNHLLGFIRL